MPGAQCSGRKQKPRSDSTESAPGLFFVKILRFAQDDRGSNVAPRKITSDFQYIGKNCVIRGRFLVVTFGDSLEMTAT